MRITVVCQSENEEVIAEEVRIPGVNEKFALHRTPGKFPRTRWSVTHVDSGYSFVHADTINDAILGARITWTLADKSELLAEIERSAKVLLSRYGCFVPALNIEVNQ